MIEPRRTTIDDSPGRRGVLQSLARLLRGTDKTLADMPIFRIAEQLGKLSVVVAIVFYFAEADERRRSRQAEAWQVIQAASGAGKIPFIEALHEDQGSLAGIDIRGIEGDALALPAADLRGARLDDLAIAAADFHDANLARASLAGVRLKKANLAGAKLAHVDLSHSDLQWANLAGADLSDADLRGANMFGADLTGANLSRAKVDAQTNLGGCILRDAALCAIDLRAASIANADVAGAICLMVIVTPEQAADLKNVDRVPKTRAATALARAKLCGGNQANGTMQLNVPDRQLCFDPARLMEMTIADFAELTLRDEPAESPGLTILEKAAESPLAAALADAHRQFIAERQAQRERATLR